MTNYLYILELDSRAKPCSLCQKELKNLFQQNEFSTRAVCLSTPPVFLSLINMALRNVISLSYETGRHYGAVWKNLIGLIEHKIMICPTLLTLST